MGARFDDYVMVDWSAASQPRRGGDSIWIAHGRRAGGRLAERTVNAPTRAQARAAVGGLLERAVARRACVLVGWDFAHGYPAGLAAALGLAADGGGDGREPPWRRLWAELTAAVVDAPDNANNRWEVARALNRRLGGGGGPFWNRPARVAGDGLPGRAPVFPHRTGRGTVLAEYRIAERRLRAAGRRVHSVWKLYTAGSVGSQTLLGIPVVGGLRDDPRLAGASRVWPFETGFAADPTAGRRPCIVHAEVWPGLLELAGALRRMQPRDRAQVTGLVRHLAVRDGAGGLDAMFDRPAGLGEGDVAACLGEEGWILGA